MKLQYCVKFGMAAALPGAFAGFSCRQWCPQPLQRSLIDAAKREGEVVYYASMNLAEANAIIGEFEKRYPFIKVKLHRTGSEKLLTRVLTEFRAKKLRRCHSDRRIQHAYFQSQRRAGALHPAIELITPKILRKTGFGRRSITTPT